MSPDEQTYLIIEPVVVSKQKASGELTHSSPGFFIFKAFDHEGTFVTRFFPMSPRYLPTHFTKLMAQKETGLKDAWKIKMKITKVSKANYDPLVDVIP